MKNIPLTQGKFAIVDDEDYEWLNQWKWHYNHNGYAVRFIKNGNKKKYISMHRFILNTPINKLTDHINSNGLDNRRSNLRIVTSQQNATNRKTEIRNTSGFKGVMWNKASKKWRVVIEKDNKKIHIGMFEDINEACKIYNQKAKELFGEFARLNHV